MNLVYGEIVAVFVEDGVAMGRLRVRGALTKAALSFVPDAQPGDLVLMCDGVAINKVQSDSGKSNRKSFYVPGNTRKSS